MAEEVKGRTFEEQESVETDGTNFADCNFNSAILVYRGGEHPFFDRCSSARTSPGASWDRP